MLTTKDDSICHCFLVLLSSSTSRLITKLINYFILDMSFLPHCKIYSPLNFYLPGTRQPPVYCLTESRYDGDSVTSKRINRVIYHRNVI